MRTHTLSVAATVTALLLPLSAFAYVSPEDVLFSPDFSLPPSPRGAEQRVDLQRQQSADRRADMLNQLHGSAPESPEGLPAGATGSPDFLDIQQILELLQKEGMSDMREPTDKATGANDVPTDGSTMDEGDLRQAAGLSARETRILDRIERNQDLGRVLSQGEVMETLHGGAPLTHTGPGLVIAGTALLCGALWTLARPGKAAETFEK